MREQIGYCGPDVVQQIAHKEDIFISQSELADVMRTTNQEGTSHLGMLMGVRELGLKAFKVVGLKIEELKDFLPHNYVIVNWIDGGDELEDGHYSILTEVSDKVYLNDYEMNIDEFEKKWYDFDRGKRVDKWALIIKKQNDGRL